MASATRPADHGLHIGAVVADEDDHRSFPPATCFERISPAVRPRSRKSGAGVPSAMSTGPVAIVAPQSSSRRRAPLCLIRARRQRLDRFRRRAGDLLPSLSGSADQGRDGNRRLVRVVGAAPIARHPAGPRAWCCCADHPRLDVWPDRPHRRGHPASRTQWKTALRKKRSLRDGLADGRSRPLSGPINPMNGRYAPE